MLSGSTDSLLKPSEPQNSNSSLKRMNTFNKSDLRKSTRKNSTVDMMIRQTSERRKHEAINNSFNTSITSLGGLKMSVAGGGSAFRVASNMTTSISNTSITQPKPQLYQPSR